MLERGRAILGLLCLLGLPLSAPATAEDPPAATDVRVMLIGSFHFRPSTSDVISLETDDMLAPARQRELEALSASLATFEPTVIALENVTSPPDYVDESYEKFGPDMLAENVSEHVQVGFRLAARLGLERVHGIDERASEGEPDYFPFDALMAHIGKTGRMEEFNARFGEVRATIEAEQARLNTLPIGRALAEANNGLLSSPDFYYEMLDYDLGEDQPAATLNGYWFMRNAKTFAKLQDIAEPGDRVVVLFGAGHRHWLKHLVEHTPGYTYVDPTPYLLGAE